MLMAVVLRIRVGRFLRAIADSMSGTMVVGMGCLSRIVQRVVQGKNE